MVQPATAADEGARRQGVANLFLDINYASDS
jgi:hypothetical protein